MPRQRGMLGPGSARMGGGGAKPGVPKTPMAGKPPGAPPGGLPGGGLGGPPPRPRPPMGGPPPGLAGPAPGGAGPGMGASGGFKKGGIAKRMDDHDEDDKPMKFAKGGVVKGGGDTKARHRSSGSFK